MEIILAENAGFCSGVKKAVKIAENYASQNGEKYTLGPLIHNRHVVEELEKKGIRPIIRLEDAKGGELIIRSHGASPESFKAAEELDIKIIDATCPFVKKAQEIVSNLAKHGDNIIIVGDHNHPEVQAMVGWSNGKACVVESCQELDNINFSNKRVAVVSQTTQTENNFNNVVQTLQNKGYSVETYNTICKATHLRQKSALSLAKEVDAMIVIGGYNSANTRKLAKICSSECPTYHIEHSGELKKEWFTGLNKIGITAGASTPDRIIEEVVDKMVEMNNEVKNEEQVEKAQEPVQSASEEAEAKNQNEQDAMEGHLEENLNPLQKGQIIKGKVIQIKDKEVLVDIGAKSEGIIPLSELSVFRIENPEEVVKPGDEVEVQVLKVENEEGNPVLSKKRVERQRAWEKLQETFENESAIEGTVREVVKGGLLVDVGLRGFVPASLVDRDYIENLEEFVGKNIRMKIIELDKSKNKIVLSRKAVQDEEYEKKRQETLNSLKEGDVVHGVVRRITDFGAFVDIGGIDGLLHVSEISWGRVEHPSDVLSEGQEIDVKVLSVDKEKERVSLGLKQLKGNPWDKAAEKYPAGTIVKGKVVRTAPFGAFVEIEPGVEGLVHISQLSHEHVEKTEDVVDVGDEVEVKVLGVDTEAQRMSLSVKEAKNVKPEKKAIRKEKEKEEEKKDDLPETGVKLGDLYGDLLRKKVNDKE